MIIFLMTSKERQKRMEQFKDINGYELIRSEELADVYSYVVMMADELGLDLDEIALEKLEKTKAKYPVEKFKGISTKYNKL